MSSQKTAESLLRFCDVSKSFETSDGTRTVLQGFSFSLQPRERVFLVGPNGSGKTTILRIAVGQEQPTSGKYSRGLSQSSAYISLLPQDYRNALFPWFPLSTNLKLGFPSADDSGSGFDAYVSRFQEHLAAMDVSLDLRKYPYQLSGGEQQLFLVARLMAGNAALVVLDEPFSAIDYRRRRLLVEYFSEWLARSESALLGTSHDFEDAIMLADRILVMGKGAREGSVEVDLDWPRRNLIRNERVFQLTLSKLMEQVR